MFNVRKTVRSIGVKEKGWSEELEGAGVKERERDTVFGRAQ